LRLLQESSGLDPLVCTSTKLREKLVKMELVEVPPQDRWRVSYLARLLEQRQVAKYLGLEEKEMELTGLVDSLCVN
jgi:hypothetical protein